MGPASSRLPLCSVCQACIHRLVPYLFTMRMTMHMTMHMTTQIGLGSSVLAARRLDSEPVPFEDEYDEVRLWGRGEGAVCPV